ncbi:xylulokinase [Chloroflexota bacterium]
MISDRARASVITIDVGTSSLKAVLYSRDGRILGSSSQWYSYDSDQPGWAEGNPEDWWVALQDALGELRREGFALEKAEALACTGMMHGAVLMDDNDQIIPPTILWLDRRATGETEELQDLLRLPLYQLNSTHTLPKLLWLHRHRPEVLAKTHAILWPKDYLRFRLTGEYCTDLTEALGAALLDWDSHAWATERLDAVGLDAAVLPKMRPASEDGGAIRPDVARSLGLSPEIRVVVGMGDAAALFGAAPPKTGRVTCSMGSSSMIFSPIAAGQSVEDPDRRLYVYPFGPYPLLGGISSTTGSSLVWAYEKICQGEALGSSFEECVARALEVEPGAEGLCFLPYLAGERSPYWNDELRGGFYGLQLTHDYRHQVRAVMEGVAYSLRHLLDIYEELGVSIHEIALAGGGTTTEGWPQIFADACQRDVLIYAGKETVTRVMFALCKEHLGLASFENSLLQTFDEPAVVHHRQELESRYDEGYRRYRALAQFALQQAA